MAVSSRAGDIGDIRIECESGRHKLCRQDICQVMQYAIHGVRTGFLDWNLEVTCSRETFVILEESGGGRVITPPIPFPSVPSSCPLTTIGPLSLADPVAACYDPSGVAGSFVTDGATSCFPPLLTLDHPHCLNVCCVRCVGKRLQRGAVVFISDGDIGSSSSGLRVRLGLVFERALSGPGRVVFMSCESRVYECSCSCSSYVPASHDDAQEH